MPVVIPDSLADSFVEDPIKYGPALLAHIVRSRSQTPSPGPSQAANLNLAANKAAGGTSAQTLAAPELSDRLNALLSRTSTPGSLSPYTPGFNSHASTPPSRNMILPTWRHDQEPGSTTDPRRELASTINKVDGKSIQYISPVNRLHLS